MRREDLPLPITYGSVCSGIEAATAAWHPLGWHPAWFAEIEKFPAAVLAHHHPSVPNLGDMTKIAAMVRAGLVCAPDVLVGGTPCQAFSIAGLRASLDDARGQLTLSFVDLANAIDTVRHVRGEQPATIVWENVPGVLSTPDNAFGCFLGALAGEDVPLVAPGGKWSNAGCVYGPQRTVAWRVLDAQYFGVAQRRRRVFVIASARKGFDPTEVLFKSEGVRRDFAPSREARKDVTAGTLRSTDGGSDVDHARAGHLHAIDLRNGKLTGDVAHTLQAGDHAPDPGGTPHILAPVLSAPVQRSIERPRGDGLDTLIAFSSKDYGADAEYDLSPTLRAGNHHGSHANAGCPPAIAFDAHQDCMSSTDVFGALGSSSPQAQVVSYAIQAGALRTNPNSGPDGVGVQAHIAYTLEARAEVQAVCFAENSRGELRLEGGDGQRTGALSTGGGKPGQGQPVVCITGDITHTLKAEGFDASEDGTGRGQPIIAFKPGQSEAAGAFFATEEFAPTLQAQNNGSTAVPAIQTGMAVRRLTPRECERLQAFPDDYTLIPYGRVVKLEKLEADWVKYLLRGGVMTLEQVCQAAADGPRYKALGNSMCVFNMRWIGRRIHYAITGAWPACANFTHEREIGTVAA